MDSDGNRDNRGFDAAQTDDAGALPLVSEDVVAELAWAIDMTQGQFSLILARCNYASVREYVATQLRETHGIDPLVLRLEPETKGVYTRIREAVGPDTPTGLMVFGLEELQNLDQIIASMNQVREEFRKHCHYAVVLWVTDDVMKRLQRLAADFESWATTIEFVISTEALLQAIRQGADTVFANALAADSTLSFSDLVNTLDLGSLHYSELAAALADLRRRGQSLDPQLQASLDFILGLSVGDQADALVNFQRSLQFWQGNEKKSEGQAGTAVAVASPPVAIAVGGEPVQPRSPSHDKGWMSDSALDIQVVAKANSKNGMDAGSAVGSNSIAAPLKAALLYFFIGRYHYRNIDQLQHQSIDWQPARQPLEQCIALFEQADRPDLVAKVTTHLERILERMRDWEALAQVAERSRRLHQTYGPPLKLARDYGFLAEVALERQEWEAAREAAAEALSILEQHESYLWEQQLYLVFLAQAERQLLNRDAAIACLIAAKSFGDQGHPQIYSRVLQELRNLYLEQRDYLEAFRLKQARYAIEQQYGLRAFIGAGRLQTRRHAGSVERDDPESLQETVAPEIIASGRQRDLQELIQRVGRNDSKLTVVHGYSGVGKSSLINAGLVPALRQRAIGIQENLPVPIRSYTNWVDEIARLLEEARQTATGELSRSMVSHVVPHTKINGLSNTKPGNPAVSAAVSGMVSSLVSGVISSVRQGDRPSGFPVERPPVIGITDTPSGNFGAEDTDNPDQPVDPAAQQAATAAKIQQLLSQIRRLEQQNFRLILIFDQFEEFFFVYPDPIQRRSFFEFLGECLNILSVKIILSLREDYLHYLLEFNRLPGMRMINNDILGKQILYGLDNFTRDDARAIIQDLTQRSRFYLEPSLIDALVNDLESDLGEIRPIELQVVGAQLQEDKITTLEQYQACGEKPKEELIKRYLEAVVADCGLENQQVAEQMLYLLTDKRGTRPLKTREDLFLGLRNSLVNSQQLDLVLAILVQSGLVFLLPEVPADRYQLVHDYLAAFIRQQRDDSLEERLEEVEERLDQVEQANHILAEAQRQAADEPLEQKGWFHLSGQPLVTALSTATVVLAIRFLGLLQPLELFSLDRMFQMRPLEPVDNRIVMVSINEQDLRKLQTGGLVSDDILADAIEKIKGYNPRVIGLRMIRDLPVQPGHKKLLAVYANTPNLIGIQQIATDPPVPPPPILGDPERDQVGFTDPITDPDGVMRREMLFLDDAESFAFKLAKVYLQAQGIEPTPAPFNPNFMQLGDAIFRPFEANDGGYMRADARGYQIITNFRGPANYFRRVSLSQVLENDVNPKWFQNRIVIIGTTAISWGVSTKTPYTTNLLKSTDIFTLEATANSVSQIISAALDDRALIRTWPEPVEWLWIICWAVLGANIIWRFQSGYWSAVFFVVLGTGLILGGNLLFWLGIWSPTVPALLTLVGVAISSVIFLEKQREAFRLRRTLELIVQAYRGNPVLGRSAIEFFFTSTSKKQLLHQTLTTIAFNNMRACNSPEEIANFDDRMAWLPPLTLETLGPIYPRLLNVSNQVEEELKRLKLVSGDGHTAIVAKDDTFAAAIANLRNIHNHISPFNPSTFAIRRILEHWLGILQRAHREHAKP